MSKKTMTLVAFTAAFRELELSSQGKNILTDKEIEDAYNLGLAPNELAEAEGMASLFAMLSGQDEETVIRESIDAANTGTAEELGSAPKED